MLLRALLLAERNPGRVIVWSLVLLGVIIALYAVVMLVRRRMISDDDGPAPVGFTLGDLRRLHAQGQITTEEFEKAKARIVASTRAALERQQKKPVDPA